MTGWNEKIIILANITTEWETNRTTVPKIPRRHTRYPKHYPTSPEEQRGNNGSGGRRRKKNIQDETLDDKTVQQKQPRTIRPVQSSKSAWDPNRSLVAPRKCLRLRKPTPLCAQHIYGSLGEIPGFFARVVFSRLFWTGLHSKFCGPVAVLSSLTPPRLRRDNELFASSTPCLGGDYYTTLLKAKILTTSRSPHSV